MLKTKIYSEEIVEEIVNENSKDDQEIASPRGELDTLDVENPINWRETKVGR